MPSNPQIQTLYPETLDRWFPLERQNYYVSLLVGRVGFTRRRAECFVRLWAYLLLKQQLASGRMAGPPLTELTLPDDFISCTHREAAALFYARQEKGSDRSAGLMLDKLLDLRVVEKQFDGNTSCLKINISLNLILPKAIETPQSPESLQFQTDAFDPRCDAIPVASFLARNYTWMNNTANPLRIAKCLREWARQYPTGMRVLRRCDNHHPVGFYIFYPTAKESEDCFFQSPTNSLYLTSDRETDLIKIAPLGDPNCTSVFVRSWTIDPPYNRTFQLCQLLEDAKQTLQRMQADFPNLCDLYSLIIHPSYEDLVNALGFQRISQDPLLSIHWMYLSIDRFLALDIQKALSATALTI